MLSILYNSLNSWMNDEKDLISDEEGLIDNEKDLIDNEKMDLIDNNKKI